MTQQILPVRGMHCASCASIISKKVGKLKGVASIDVNFATEKATIDYDASVVSAADMNQEIEKLGYSFVSANNNHSETTASDSQTDELENMKIKVQVLK